MEFRIADTFTDSLARLTCAEQTAAKTTAFDLQANPSNPGLQFHRIDKSRDKHFWSVRVNRDLRIVVHRTDTSLLLCYVHHHDNAYVWAERRKLEVHPQTGAAQMVELRETIQEIIIPKYVEVEQPALPKPPLFAKYTDDELLNYGVPAEWFGDVRQVNEDTILDLSDHLPAEAAEALLELATGGRPQVSPIAVAHIKPFDHPDAQRRFRVISDVEELTRALDYPWDKWTTFLHPAQRQLIERDYSGPARVAGSAGTGKTVVALHRAAFLARKNRDSRILLTTFSDALSNALRSKLRLLINNEPLLGDNIEVHSVDAIGKRLYELQFGPPKIASTDVVRRLLAESGSEADAHKFSRAFLESEWEDVVDAWQLETWEAYRDVQRLGRRTRLPEAQRAVLWSIFDRVRMKLLDRGQITYPQLFSRLATQLAERKQLPFDYTIVDESQDVSVSQLRFLAALGGGQSNGLFFAGDLGQRIFQQPFSWKALGVDIRGRSSILKVNYRTSHQIRMQADRLLGPEVSDVDGNTEERGGTVSVFNGAPPTIRVLTSPESEIQTVGDWLLDRSREGLKADEMGVFVRSAAELDRAKASVQAAGLDFGILDVTAETIAGHVAIGTMPLAKGLEFRAVAVMACDDEIIPLQDRIETASDDTELEEVYNTERHLLYVACTRARDHLLVTGTIPASEFLDDMIV